MLVTLSVSERRQRQEVRLATRDRFSFAVHVINRVPVPAKCTPPLVSEEFVVVLALPCRMCCTALSRLGKRNETINAGFLLSLTLKIAARCCRPAHPASGDGVWGALGAELLLIIPAVDISHGCHATAVPHRQAGLHGAPGPAAVSTPFCSKARLLR